MGSFREHVAVALNGSVCPPVCVCRIEITRVARAKSSRPCPSVRAPFAACCATHHLAVSPPLRVGGGGASAVVCTCLRACDASRLCCAGVVCLPAVLRCVRLCESDVVCNVAVVCRLCNTVIEARGASIALFGPLPRPLAVCGERGWRRGVVGAIGRRRPTV